MSEERRLYPPTYPCTQHAEDLKELKTSIGKMCKRSSSKVDRWIFILFATTALTMFGWLFTRVHQHRVDNVEHIVKLEANQHILMKYFDLHPVATDAEAMEIVKNGDGKIIK